MGLDRQADMTTKKEICKEITRYFIGDVDDPRLEERGGDGFHSDKKSCENWRKELEDMGVYGDKPSRVYTVKITLCED